jgi:uncharacterized membrane protein YdjX (TVP38/TMEM64 family)
MTNLRRALCLQLLGLGLVAVVVILLAHYFPVVAFITRAQRKIGQMEVWGGVLYPLFFAACNVLLLPGGVIAIGAGLFFGLWWGFALNLAGTIAGAAVAFFISRRLGRGWVEKRLLRHGKWAALDAAIAREGPKIIFLSQVHPLFPSSLLNYFYGFTRIRFGQCMLWIAVGQAPGLFLYAYLGTLAQLGLRLARGQTHPRAVEYVIWIGGLVLTVVATTLLARVALRILADAQTPPAVPGSPKPDSDRETPGNPVEAVR